MFACGQYHFTFIEMSSPPWGTCAKAEACSHASIYRLPRIRASLRQTLPRGPGEVTHTGTKFRRGEAGWALLGSDYGGGPVPAETRRRKNDMMCLCTHANSHIKQVQICWNKTPIRGICHMWQVDTFLIVVKTQCSYKEKAKVTFYYYIYEYSLYLTYLIGKIYKQEG